MMNNMKNMFRKCWSFSHQGKPESIDGAPWAMPGLCRMKALTLGTSRRICATAIRTTRPAAPIGMAQSVLIQRRPIRMRGAIPCWGGSQWFNRTRSSASLSGARSGSGGPGAAIGLRCCVMERPLDWISRPAW